MPSEPFDRACAEPAHQSCSLSADGGGKVRARGGARPAVEEQPALSAEQLAALAQTPASWFDEPALLDALSKLPHYDETRAQRYLCLPHRRRLDARAGAAHCEHGQRSAALYRRGGCGPDDGDLILVNKYSRLASDYVPEDPDGRARLLQRRQAQERGQRRLLRPGRGHVDGNGTAPCQRLALPQLPDAEEPLRPLPHHSTARRRPTASPPARATASIRPVLRWTSSLPAARSTASRTHSSLSGCATTPTASALSCATATAWSTSPATSSSHGTTATSASRPATFIYENDLTFEEYYAYYKKISRPPAAFTAKNSPLTAFFSRAVKGYFSALLLSNILGYPLFLQSRRHRITLAHGVTLALYQHRRRR